MMIEELNNKLIDINNTINALSKVKETFVVDNTAIQGDDAFENLKEGSNLKINCQNAAYSLNSTINKLNELKTYIENEITTLSEEGL